MVKMKERIKKSLKDNKGFSLTELIIVIAIILIMTAASFVTLTIMHSAKAKEAASSFENSLAEVISLSKNNGVDKNDNGIIDSDEEKYTIGLRIYKDGRKYYLQRCICQKQATGEYTYVNLPVSDAYIKSINEHSGKGICLSAYVDIKYYDLDGNDKSADSYVIAFNKKGDCKLGFGKYEFIKSSSGDKIVTVSVNKNGSYISK
ncbi:MAG: prepilin-type N-terminal cleavage/methylation domain-containing protein [Lachnospiraceae bacterium]|nr:prepilin-type N-terminal cleavage/methylation domain-containing protein [Lachnospiraceae bacterium]